MRPSPRTTAGRPAAPSPTLAFITASSRRASAAASAQDSAALSFRQRAKACLRESGVRCLVAERSCSSKNPTGPRGGGDLCAAVRREVGDEVSPAVDLDVQQAVPEACELLAAEGDGVVAAQHTQPVGRVGHQHARVPVAAAAGPVLELRCA